MLKAMTIHKNWKRALVKPHQTIRELIAVIDREASRAAFVVDEKMRLLGMVTDGDIRRGLLNNIGLDDPVTKIMNTNPATCTPDQLHPDHIRHRLHSLTIQHLPVVEKGKLIGVIYAEDLYTTHRYENAVFLMAGGFGTRLKPLTEKCPKPMLKVGDRPILQIILERFIEAGFYRFYMSTHYLPEVIQDHFGDGSAWGVQIQYVHEPEPLGTGGALGLLPDDVGNHPLIMMNGDLLTRVNFQHLLRFHQRHKGIATACLREYEMQIPYGVIKTRHHKLISINEKPLYRFYVNAGIYVIEPALCKQIQLGERIDMPTLLERQLADNKTVATFPVHEYWLDVGHMKDFEQAQLDVQELF